MPSTELAPVISIQSGKPMTNSRDVAELFGKRHDNVLSDIRRLISEGVLFFQETPYVHAQNGQAYHAFNMTRDGFALLAMGFTGKKALQFKIAYINRFNEMEERLRPQFASTGIGRHVHAGVHLARGGSTPSLSDRTGHHGGGR